MNSITTRNILDVQDISARTHRYVDRTNRRTDPNNPYYVVNGMEIKDDPLSKPKPLPKQIDNFLLKTKDITGAEADSRHASNFARTEVRNIMNIADIEGAHADTIKHSIVSNRRTNPLQPVYQSLDPGELLLPVIDPIIPPDIIKVPTMPARVRAKPQSGHGAKADDSGGTSFAATNQTAAMTSTWGGSSTSGGVAIEKDKDFEPVLFTSQPSSARKPASAPGLGLALPSHPTTSSSNQYSTGGAGMGNYSTGIAIPSSSSNANPSARGAPASFNFTTYSNTNFNAAPYSATAAAAAVASTGNGSGQVSARGFGGGGGSAPSSGRLAKRAQAALEADIAMVRGLN